MSDRAYAKAQATQTETSPRSNLLQRTCACGQHTIAGGECSSCHNKRSLLQRSHRAFGQPSVSTAAQSNASAQGNVSSIKNTIDSEAHSGQDLSQIPIVQRVLNDDGGQPLDAGTRTFMEPRFGYDFSHVRVHTDQRAAESARAVNALAYTVGQDIVFSRGQFAVGTDAGRRLLAHELTHVVQQTRSGSAPATHSQSDSLEQDAKHAEFALTARNNGIKITGSSPPTLARSPGPGSGVTPQVRQNGLTDAEKNLLNQIRLRLVSDDKKATAIVGVLIAEDGRQFEFVSGGGQGFSSHIEGKATAKMNELGITKATLLLEKEPCQICDRSVYPSDEGPEAPLLSSRTGEPIDYQISKINTALSTDSELTVVDPEAAAIYRGVKSTSGTTASTPKPTVTASKVPSEPPGDVSAPKTGPEATTAVPKVPTEPETTIAVPKVPTETVGEALPEASKGSADTAIGAFQIALLLLQFLPDPLEGQAIKEKLDQEWKSAKWQARLSALQPEIAHAEVSIYYSLKFKILYSVQSSPKPQAFGDDYSVKGVEILEINLSKAKTQDCGKVDPPKRPDDASPVFGGGYYWSAQKICTSSAQVAGAEQTIGPTYGLTGDTEIRNALIAADAATIAQIPTGEKIRIINRLFDGWVSDSDIGGIRKVYQNTPSTQQSDVKQAIERRIPDLASIGQRTQVRVILAGG